MQKMLSVEASLTHKSPFDQPALTRSEVAVEGDQVAKPQLGMRRNFESHLILQGHC